MFDFVAGDTVWWAALFCRFNALQMHLSLTLGCLIWNCTTNRSSSTSSSHGSCGGCGRPRSSIPILKDSIYLNTWDPRKFHINGPCSGPNHAVWRSLSSRRFRSLHSPTKYNKRMSFKRDSNFHIHRIHVCWLIFMINVGTYTGPLDLMGYCSIHLNKCINNLNGLMINHGYV